MMEPQLVDTHVLPAVGGHRPRQRGIGGEPSQLQPAVMTWLPHRPLLATPPSGETMEHCPVPLFTTQ